MNKENITTNMKATFTVLVIDGQDGSYGSRIIPYPMKYYMEEVKLKYPDVSDDDLEYQLMEDGILSVQEHHIEI